MGYETPTAKCRRKQTVSPRAIACHILDGLSTVFECDRFAFIVSFPAILRQVERRDSGRVPRQEII